MCAAVLQKNFHVDNPAFLHAAAKHRVEEIQLPVVVDPLPNKVGHFQKNEQANDERYPQELTQLSFQNIILYQKRQHNIANKNADDLWNGANEVEQEGDEKIRRFVPCLTGEVKCKPAHPPEHE